MPKAEAPGHVGRAHEIEPQELVDRVHRRGLGHRGRGRRQLGLERIARDRRSFEHEARGVRQQRELLAERRGDASTGRRSPAATLVGGRRRPAARSSDRASCSR